MNAFRDPSLFIRGFLSSGGGQTFFWDPKGASFFYIGQEGGQHFCRMQKEELTTCDHRQVGPPPGKK